MGFHEAEKLASMVITPHHLRREGSFLLQHLYQNPKKITCLGCDSGKKPHVQENELLLLTNLCPLLSKGMGSRTAGICEGGGCVVVVVVVTVTWPNLKGRDGGNDHPVAPPLLRQELKKLSAARQKLSVERLPTPVPEHLHCTPRTASLRLARRDVRASAILQCGQQKAPSSFVKITLPSLFK